MRSIKTPTRKGGRREKRAVHIFFYGVRKATAEPQKSGIDRKGHAIPTEKNRASREKKIRNV